MAHAELRGVVALDGPSGTGKSTVARKLAAALSASYLDTGAMYRAVTLAVLRAGVPVADADAVAEVAAASLPEMGSDPRDPAVSMAGEDVALEIRGPEVTGAVSAVSAVARVRELLVAEQRRIIADALASPGGVVVEGRDIGTVVARDAGLKVYLTASAQARARRRSDQDVAAGRLADLERTHADVQRRDAFDSGRAVSPLRMAEDAVELDTTDLDVAGVLDRLLGLAEARGLFAGVGTIR
ncbi:MULTISPECIES: (d)CMP kinase [Saccharopolyspora]|uniref:Cytidylate kinase n=1 Tax=Saccharopolyspora gregorii TaxID=33914 RepID=A0ABP6RV78_9PSEU|nr:MULTISPECIES: (d)CMP kinase [Saccharopolyspora]MCA1189754.1 (d)CMP kinase [Saccharopolyspora sp. 6T]MCA1280670.1 (d)CMP kinase [Saccharopolyspora sp. 7B]